MFFATRFTLRQPKTPVRNTTNLRTFCFEDYHKYAFQENLCPVTLPCCSLDLCILFKFIFLYLRYILPHSYAFHTVYFTPIFSYVYYYTKYFFFISDDAVARNLSIIVNFSSQRPYLNYIFLSNVYSFDTMEFSMKHKC